MTYLLNQVLNQTTYKNITCNATKNTSIKLFTNRQQLNQHVYFSQTPLPTHKNKRAVSANTSGKLSILPIP
jgi:hypothetical protein